MNIDLNLTLDELNTHYTQLKEAITAQFASNIKVNKAQWDLKNAQNAILLANAADPKALGVNEAARAAKLDEMCKEQKNALDQAEVEHTAMGHAVRIAQLCVDQLRQQKHWIAIAHGVSLN